MCRKGTLNSPLPLESTRRVSPVSVCLTVIFALGTTAPEASSTTPTMVPVVIWPDAQTAVSTASATQLKVDIEFLPDSKLLEHETGHREDFIVVAKSAAPSPSVASSRLL